MAWFASWIRKLEQCGQAIPALGWARYMGKDTWMYCWWSWLRVVDDWCEPCQGSSSRGRSCGRKPGHGTYKRGLNTKIHLAVDAHGMPVRVLVTAGTVADCTQGCALIDGIFAEWLMGDKGYDSNAIIAKAQEQNMQLVIPPKKNRRVQREYDKYLYRLRHLVENAFLHLKRWRGIATRYAKNTSSFLAAVQIRCIALWANLLAWTHVHTI